MPRPPSRPVLTPPAPPWPLGLRLVFLVIWLLIGLAAFWLTRPVWWLITLALLVGYLLQPVVGFLTRLKVPRKLASLITLLLLLVLIVLIPTLLTRALLRDLGSIRIDIAYVTTLINRLLAFLLRLPQILPSITLFGYTIDLTPYYREIADRIANITPTAVLDLVQSLTGIITGLVRSTFQVVGAATLLATNVIARVVLIVFGALLLLLMSYYAVTDLPRGLNVIVRLAPEAYQPEWRELWRRTGAVWSAFFRGQLILSVTIGVIVWAGLTVIGVPGALVLGLISGVLEVIPTLGPILALIPGVLLALLQGSIQFPELSNLTVALIVLIFYFVVQQAENLFLVPRILGHSVGIHPALILIAVSVFALHLGILGAFIATPVLATVFEWFSYFHARMLGREPYPELVAAPEPPVVARPEPMAWAEQAPTPVSALSEVEPPVKGT